jgi:hypothetical protein
LQNQTGNINKILMTVSVAVKSARYSDSPLKNKANLAPKSKDASLNLLGDSPDQVIKRDYHFDKANIENSLNEPQRYPPGRLHHVRGNGKAGQMQVA